MIETLLSKISAITISAVILGHFFFAFGQWYRWPAICKKLTDLSDIEIQRTSFLGKSISVYNAAIGLGLLSSFALSGIVRLQVQAVVLILIIFTAFVGWRGTKGNTILYLRVLPAVAALIATISISV